MAQPISANFNPVISSGGNENHSPEGTPTATSALTPTGIPTSLQRCPLHATDTSIYRYPSFVAVPATHSQQVQLTPGGNPLQNYMKQNSSPNSQNINNPTNVFNTQDFSASPFNTLQKTLQPSRNPFSPHMAAYPGVNPTLMLHENQFVGQQRFQHQQFPGLLAHHQNFTGTPRYKLTPERASPLLEWFEKHKHHPYPSRMEKISLCDITQLNYTQVSNWFANARRRMKQRQKVSDSGTPGPDSKQNRDSTFAPY
ncbi:Iroquois homeobox (Irx) transcription factor [Oopsacas minuta]|uniref:Iroquois homeobox (Irx) transcription factor n=1 Tax=Oopsacas minuta TaxID=111878 RepID=A0AAV7KAQ3_9METZ|nr:Iroquois homeobox (Irx) transcription factor [Oopsacas minuta]